MIAEPYICIKGDKLGIIEWRSHNMPGFVPSPSGLDLGLANPPLKFISGEFEELWCRYADFERYKLNTLKLKDPSSSYDFWMNTSLSGSSVAVYGWGADYDSWNMIDYGVLDYEKDSESSRLLKRAEFLKAVCEKEGVEWLPEKRKLDSRDDCRCSPETGLAGCPVHGGLQDVKIPAPCTICSGTTFWRDRGETIYCMSCLGEDGMKRLRDMIFPKPARDYYTRDEIDLMLRKIVEEFRGHPYSQA